MISDYFTNPLQGTLFKLFRDLIMGNKNIGDILADIESPTKERVGNQNKVTENSNMKNNDKCKIRVQVRNIDSNLNLSLTSQKEQKKR